MHIATRAFFFMDGNLEIGINTQDWIDELNAKEIIKITSCVSKSVDSYDGYVLVLTVIYITDKLCLKY